MYYFPNNVLVYLSILILCFDGFCCSGLLRSTPHISSGLARGATDPGENILTGKVAQKDDQMIAQGGISIVYELNRLVSALRRRCFFSVTFCLE